MINKKFQKNNIVLSESTSNLGDNKGNNLKNLNKENNINNNNDIPNNGSSETNINKTSLEPIMILK